MPEIRLATFNVENLLMRLNFASIGIDDMRQRLTDITSRDQAEHVAGLVNVFSEDDRTLTAQALAATRADVCALQEVENLLTLTSFHNMYLSRWSQKPYPFHVLLEGNDRRGIDVGLLSRIKVVDKKSHADVSYADLGIAPPAGVNHNERIFRRDCLEVDLAKDGVRLTLYVCHFKSMYGGRDESRKIRDGEARAVRALIERRFDNPADENWIVLGDLNDYIEIDGVPDHQHGLSALIADGFASDMAQLCISEPNQRWSHHFKKLDQYTALDHILLSPRLADLNQHSSISYVRAGLPWRATRHKGYRLSGIGWANPKASDHCPLAATIKF